MRKIVLVTFSCFVSVILFSQGAEAPNTANSSQLPASAAQADKMMGNPVNLFSGIPSISIPIYNFKSNSGVAVSVSLDYSGGGIQVGESATFVGLGWYLNAGGIITRTVRGMPDDMPDVGFMYASAIPADWRSNASKYYHDSIDAQQDVFQFNFPGHSGKFFMGKNGQIALVPSSKIRIVPTFQEASIFNQTLKSFRIIAEDGIKYDFEIADYITTNIDMNYFGGSSTPTASGYYGKGYGTAWYLTKIISPFNTDTINFNYKLNSVFYNFKLPEITFVNNATGVRKSPTNAPGTGNSQSRKIESIEFPDKTKISFIYSYNIKYDKDDYILSKIKISDTAFRFGYMLDYQTKYTFTNELGHNDEDVIRPLLKSVTPYTKWEKQKGYKFDYYSPLLVKAGEIEDTIQNKRDFWGFYNGAINGTNLIPSVNGYTWGANRNPNTYVTASSLANFYLPGGGFIQYTYELNDHYPYTKQSNVVSIAAQSSSQNNITLNQVFNGKHQLIFFLDKSVARTGSAPISGSGNLNLYLKSTDGSILYLSSSISLYEVFYSGLRTWTFNLPNGTYRLETTLSAGTSVSGSLPVNIQWENKNVDNTVNYQLSGGLRVATVTKYIDDVSQGSFIRYKYLTADGKSSGFLGDMPRYDFPYREILNFNGTTTTDYTAVTSEPLGVSGYGQIGYNRVEVIRDTYSAGNLGKEVHEFTDLQDVNSNASNYGFPYTPQDIRSWGLGLPKRISAYDSSGVLVKRTSNVFQFDTVFYENNNFKSLKLGHNHTNYYGDPNIYPLTKVKSFIGEEFYLTSGKASLKASYDTMYYSNGSFNASYQLLEYDNNYNITKTITSYDRNRGLRKEIRMYYPYNYTIGGGIGKLRDSLIISQVISMESWITDDYNFSLVGGAATSFRSIGNGDVKPDTIYSFESNKPIAQATIGNFDPSKLNRNVSYFKPQSHFTSYDNKGNLAEVKSLVTGLSNSVITDYDQQYATATVSNAVQANIAFTSFESLSNGNWTVGSTLRDASESLSGKRRYNLSNGNISKSGLSSGKTYLITLWAKTGASVVINGAMQSNPIASQVGWNLFSIEVTGITSVTISGSGLVDEVRLHPRESNMMTSSFEPMIGTLSTVDANNSVIHNEYDKLNRLKLIRDKDKNIVKRFEYADESMLINTVPVWVSDTVCSATNIGYLNIIKTDINPYSDSLGYVKTQFDVALNCNCPGVSTLPQFAVVNGVCELGTLVPVSTSQVKKDGVWVWECVHKYCFSNGAWGTYTYKTWNPEPCTQGCYID